MEKQALVNIELHVKLPFFNLNNEVQLAKYLDEVLLQVGLHRILQMVKRPLLLKTTRTTMAIQEYLLKDEISEA